MGLDLVLVVEKVYHLLLQLLINKLDLCFIIVLLLLVYLFLNFLLLDLLLLDQFLAFDLVWFERGVFFIIFFCILSIKEEKKMFFCYYCGGRERF